MWHVKCTKNLACPPFLRMYSKQLAIELLIESMKIYDHSSCSSTCEISLCSNCASIWDGSQDITVNERPFVPPPPCEDVMRNLSAGDDNSILSHSNPTPGNVPHSGNDLIGGQPSQGGVSRTVRKKRSLRSVMRLATSRPVPFLGDERTGLKHPMYRTVSAAASL
jgi:hypothetical protein